jgi:hypothetical protein
MSTEAKPDQSELAAASQVMLDGFREAGVLSETIAYQPSPTPGTTPE